jgi:hypothetical protein
MQQGRNKNVKKLCRIPKKPDRAVARDVAGLNPTVSIRSHIFLIEGMLFQGLFRSFKINYSEIFCHPASRASKSDAAPRASSGTRPEGKKAALESRGPSTNVMAWMD